MSYVVPKTELPHLDKTRRRHVGVLRERLRYLHDRLGSGTSSESARAYQRDEIAALEWALEQVERQQ